MAEGSIGSICKLFKEAGRDSRAAACVALAHTLMTSLNAGLAYAGHHQTVKIFNAVVAALDAAIATPVAVIAMQASQLQKECEHYLEERLGPEFMTGLSQGKLDMEGARKIIKLLDDINPGISASQLRMELGAVTTQDPAVRTPLEGILKYLDEKAVASAEV